MSESEQTELVSFESIAKENGIRFWYAHEFGEYLGYKDFDSFMNVVRKARASSEQIGVDTDSEFVQHTTESGFKTYKLTRFALLLCALHADEKKPKVAEVKVALAKFADMAIQAYGQLDRISERQNLSHGENYMEGVAREHGLTQNKFGLFKDSGYRGMYNMGIAQLKKYKGVDSGTLYDFMGITELAANTFRVTQTAESIRQNNIRSENGMINTAKSIGSQVRDMVINNTGKLPENLPTEPKITSIKSDLKKVRKNMQNNRQR